MNETVSERPVTLQDSSWELLDAAAQMDSSWTPSKFIDALLQCYLQEDGSFLERQEAILKLRKLFGDNHG